MPTHVLALILGAFLVGAHADDVKAVRSVAIISATDPTEYRITVRTSVAFLFPLAATAAHFTGKARAATLTSALLGKGLHHGAYLTDRVAQNLRASGYEVVMLDTVLRNSEKPDSIDYEKLDLPADIGLHVRFDEIGYYSGIGSASYRPKVNVQATSFTLHSDDNPYDTTICYGVDARPNKDWAIESKEAANFDSFDLMAADLGKVDANLRDALDQIADRLVAQFKASSPLASATAALPASAPR